MGNMISEELLKKLYLGDYEGIIDFVNHDDTLEVRFKGNAAAVYYRGLSLEDLYADKIIINKSYCNGSSGMPVFKVESDCSPIESIPYLKQNVDFKFSNSSSTYETEFSQLIARENNSKKLGNTTDYFILEEEYKVEFEDGLTGDGRLDLVGVHINHSPKNRTRKAIEQRKYGIAIVEVKYLEDAYDDKEATPGIPKHISDFARFFDLQNKNVIEKMACDLEDIFSAKRKLGLIPGLSGDVDSINFSTDPNDMELILALVGHNTNSNHLVELLGDILTKYSKEITEKIFIAQTSEIGFGLYDERMIPIREYVSKYRR